jgi:hypothetical protein
VEAIDSASKALANPKSPNLRIGNFDIFCMVGLSLSASGMGPGSPNKIFYSQPAFELEVLNLYE